MGIAIYKNRSIASSSRSWVDQRLLRYLISDEGHNWRVSSKNTKTKFYPSEQTQIQKNLCFAACSSAFIAEDKD